MPPPQRSEFPPELALLFACTRWPSSSVDWDDIRRRLSAPVDWDLFLAWVRRNRVAPLTYQNLRQAGTIPIPETVIRTLRTQTTLNASRVLMQIAEAARITQRLAEAGIRSLMVKGPVLSVLAFGDPILRESQDVDLIIEPMRLREADRLIRESGYDRVVPNFELTNFQFATYQRLQCQFAYDSRQTGVTQELHWRLTTNPLLLPTDHMALWGRPDRIQVAQGTSFATLPDEELFLYLCAHGGSHMWFRLKWIADIAALLGRLGPESLQRIADRARVIGIERPFHLALILASALLTAPVTAESLARARRDTAAQRLARGACKALAWRGSPTEPVETPWFTTWLNLQSFKLRRNLGYRWSELRIRMLSLDDWALLPLPRWLSPLYVPLRPLLWSLRRLQRTNRSV
jgi:putative nucleotidyltransferase-like protein